MTVVSPDGGSDSCTMVAKPAYAQPPLAPLNPATNIVSSEATRLSKFGSSSLLGLVDRFDARRVFRRAMGTTAARADNLAHSR